jgi:hypothetical protein
MTTRNPCVRRLSLALSLMALTGGAQAAFIVHEAATSIGPTVDAFRAALGTLNANDGNHHASGRREINWDGVPDSFADPNPFPGDFFNSTTIGARARGALLSTPGTGFLVSADADNPTTTPPGFGFPVEFVPFSPERLFAPIGSNITEITFFVPGTATPAWVSGFGAVFSDVEFTGVTQIELFGLNGASLFSHSVPTSGNGGLSFLGVVADAGERIGRVRITTGLNALLGHGDFGTGATEGVVMDDFIYAEPQAVPAPGTAALLGAGWLAWRRGRRPVRKG